MPAVNHIHTYVKYKSKPGYFRCDAPDCTHFNSKEVITGKLSRCTMCGGQMILTPEDLKRVRPRCINCSDTKKARQQRKAQELTRYLGTDKFPSLLGTVVKHEYESTEDDRLEELEDEDY